MRVIFGVTATVAAIGGGGKGVCQTTASGEPFQVSVGDLDASRLQPYSSLWRVVEVAADGTRREAMRHTDRLERSAVDGAPVWRQVQGDLAEGQPGGSLNAVTDFRTFRPIEALTRGPQGAYRHLRYGTSAVQLECRGTLCPPDAPRSGEVVRREVPTALATFDYWGGSFGLLFAALPLEVGRSFIVPVFHPARGLIQLRVDVEARETVRAANGDAIEAYRLRTPLTGWVYHVNNRPPYWIRLEYSRPDGTRQITERVSAAVDPA